MSILSNLTDIETLMFDLGGTLWEPFGHKGQEHVFWAAVSLIADETAETADVPFKSDIFGSRLMDILLRIGSDSLREIDVYDTLNQLFESQGLKIHKERTEQLADRFSHALSDSYALFPDTLSTLGKLKRLGFGTGIVSNTAIPASVMDRHLTESGVMKFMDFVVLSSDVGWRKPHESIYIEALKASRTAPGRVLFVGDRLLEDVIGPKTMGMKAVLIRRPGRLAKGADSRFEPDAVIDRLEEIT